MCAGGGPLHSRWKAEGVHLESGSSKQVLPKRASSIDFVGYVEAVLGHAGEYPSCVIRDVRAAGFVEAPSFEGAERPPRAPRAPLNGSHSAPIASLYDDASETEDTIPLRRDPTSHAPRPAMTSGEADSVLSSAECTSESLLHAFVTTDEVSIEDILEEVYADPPAPAPAPASGPAISFPEPRREKARLVPRAPQPTDLPVLERTNARRGRRGGWYVGAAALFVLGGVGGGLAVSRGSAFATKETLSAATSTALGAVASTAARLRGHLAPPSPPTSAVQTLEGQWTAPARVAPTAPRGRATATPGGIGEIPSVASVPVVQFESLPKAR